MDMLAQMKQRSTRQVPAPPTHRGRPSWTPTRLEIIRFANDYESPAPPVSDDRARRFRMARAFAGRTVRALAERIGVSPGAITQQELAGREPPCRSLPVRVTVRKRRLANRYAQLSPTIAKRAAKALGVEAAWLLHGITVDPKRVRWLIPPWLVAWTGERATSDHPDAKAELSAARGGRGPRLVMRNGIVIS